MSSLPLFPALGVIVWAIAMLVGIGLFFRRNPDVPFFPQKAFFLISALALGLAPWVSLLVYHFGGQTTLLGGLPNLVIGGLFLSAAVRARHVRRTEQTADTTYTFKEKGAILILGSLIGVYGVYFALTWHTPVLAIPLFFAAAAAMVAIIVMGHIGLAISHRVWEGNENVTDERDISAELYGARKAYLVLAVGIWVIPIAALAGQPAIIVANVAFAFIVAAEIVKYGALVYFYRYGVSNG